MANLTRQCSYLVMQYDIIGYTLFKMTQLSQPNIKIVIFFFFFNFFITSDYHNLLLENEKRL